MINTNTFYRMITIFNDSSFVYNYISITNYILLFACSFLLHTVYFYFMSPRTFEYLRSSYVFYLAIFICYLIFAYHGNTIYLDNTDVTVKVTLENATFSLSGEGLALIFHNLGSAGVFVAGAKIAATFVSKKATILPKSGAILAGGATTALTYKLISKGDAINNTFSSSPGISVSTGPVSLEVYNIDINTGITSLELKEILRTQFNPDLTRTITNKLDVKELGNTKILDLNKESSSAILRELERSDPDWKSKFIMNSPQEQTEVLLGHVKDFITDNVLLHYIAIYLLFLLLFFIAAKIILDHKIEIKWIQKYPRIHGWWLKYLSLYKVSNTAWMLYIIGVLIVINCSSLYSFFKILEVLEFLKK